MKLVDELRKMRNKGRYVVSIDYVLDSLRAIENDSKPKVEQLSVEESKAV